jgi:hypothetical protein
MDLGEATQFLVVSFFVHPAQTPILGLIVELMGTRTIEAFAALWSLKLAIKGSFRR